MKKAFLFQLILVVAITSCSINSKEKYMKSKLSGFVTEDYKEYFDKQMDEELDLVNKKLSKMQKEIDKLNACCQSSNLKDSFSALQNRIVALEKNKPVAIASTDANRLVVYYDLDASALSKLAQHEIIKWFGELTASGKYNDSLVFNISSFTDHVGGAEYNKKLSDKRSKAVMKYLCDAMNIPAKRIKIIPTTNPVKLNSRLLERRSEIWIN